MIRGRRLLARGPRARGPRAQGPRARLWIPTIPAALFLCVLGLLPTAAGGDLLEEETSLFIESIEVQGLRHMAPELVVAETLLIEGEAYSESELQQAIFRLQRLPFVLDARFALAKGSERGRYRLVIAVEEIRRFFFGENLTYTRFTNSVAFDSFLGQDFTFTPGGLAGIRFFVGQYGMVFGALSSHGGVQAGYSQYNLFDRRVFFSVGLTTQTCCPTQVFPLGIDPTFASWQNDGNLRQAQITLGLPLRRRFQLRFQATDTVSDEGSRRNLLDVEPGFRRVTLDYADLRQQELELALIYDSTDDPVFPSQGLAWTLALDHQSVATDLSVFQPIFGPEVDLPDGLDVDLPPFESEQLRLAFTLSQHWRLTNRQNVSLSARLAAGTADVRNLPILERRTAEALAACVEAGEECAENTLRLVESAELDVIEGYFTARHSLSLWSAERTRTHGDLRLEHTFEFGYDQTSPSLDLEQNPLFRKSFTSSVVFRNSWGLFRFSLQIADYGRDA